MTFEKIFHVESYPSPSPITATLKHFENSIHPCVSLEDRFYDIAREILKTSIFHTYLRLSMDLDFSQKNSSVNFVTLEYPEIMKGINR